MAAVIEDVVVGFEDTVGQPVITHELPDVFGRIELGRAWRQGKQRDVVGNGQLCGHVPAGLVQHDDGVCAGRNLGGDFVEMQLHGLGVAARQDEAGTDAALGADGAEDIGRLGALVVGRTGSCSAPGPPPRDPVLLPYPGFILPPDLYLGADRECRADRRQFGRECFLKSSSASSFCA